MKSWSWMHLINNLKKSHVEFEVQKLEKEEVKEHLATSRDEIDPTEEIIKRRRKEDDDYYAKGKQENRSLNWKKSSISTIPEYGSL